MNVSVVIPAYRAGDLLAAVVAAALAQDDVASYDVIVVASGVDAATPLPPLPADDRLTVLAHADRLSAAQARNIGAARDTSTAIAFLDADAVPARDWLSHSLAASDTGRRAVAGGIANGTPTSVVGTAEYLVEFLDLHPARPPRTAWHGATANLLVPRALWDRFGPFPEDMGGCEDTLFTVQCRAANAFAFEGAATVAHMNRTSLGSVVRNQYNLGRWTARLARRSAYKLKPLVRVTPLAPVAAAGRVVSIYARVLAFDRRLGPRAIVALPAVAACLAAWGAGLLDENVRLDVAAVRRRLTHRPTADAAPASPSDASS